jgi:hypothetical protein
VSTRKALPMNMPCHEPNFFITIGMGQDCGFVLVPDA